MDARYAIYFAPRPSSQLWRLGCAWLGRDAASDDPVPQPAVPGVSAARLRALTAAPRGYGFHATLKPPFRLATGHALDALCATLQRFARGRTVFPLPPLEVARLSGFLALRPAAASLALQQLADDCVVAFEPFRRAPTPAELARRRQGELSPRQAVLLEQFGYPYVLDEFRFHMTLTERLDATDAARLEPWLAQHFLTVLPAAEPVVDVCLFAQERPDAAFRILERFPLSDRAAM